MIYSFFFIAICSILIFVTFSGKEAFPFSHYPMFSKLHDVTDVVIFRIALETQEGEIQWWDSKFYRYPEIVGRKISSLKNADKNATVLAQSKLLVKILQIITIEKGNFDKYKAFHIIERSVNENLMIVDKTIEIVPFEKIKTGDDF
jgi:hypothetical protein